MSLGSTIHRLRKERSLTLEDLGERSGLNPSTISRLEDDQNPGVGAVTLSKLARVLRIDVRILYEAAGWYSTPPSAQTRKRQRLRDEELELIDTIRSAPTPQVRRSLLATMTKLAQVARDADAGRYQQPGLTIEGASSGGGGHDKDKDVSDHS